jgi:polyisoprenoid-binding protein YceI
MKQIIIFIAAMGALSVAEAATARYQIEPTSGTRVEFRSEAPLEQIVGRVQAVSGFVELDPASGGSGASAEVRVDLTKLQTGIELRDEHMRKNHLETAQFPEAMFTLSSLEIPAGALGDGVRTATIAKGQLKLHGVQQEIAPQTYLTWNRATNSVRVEASFMIKLEQFQIPRPQFLVMKLAEEQFITVDIMARAEGTSAQR